MDFQDFDINNPFDISALDTDFLPNFNFSTSTENDSHSMIVQRDMCRICFHSQNLQHISSEYIYHMLDVIKCPNHFKYPKYICANCVQHLTTTFNFLLNMNNATNYLNDYFGIGNNRLDFGPSYGHVENENTQLEFVNNYDFGDSQLEYSENYSTENSQLKYVENYDSTENTTVECKEEKSSTTLRREVMVLLTKYTIKDLKRMKSELKKRSKTQTAIQVAHAHTDGTLSKFIEESKIVLQRNSPVVIKYKLEHILKQRNPFLSKLEINANLTLKTKPEEYATQCGSPFKQDNFILSTSYGEINQSFRRGLKRNKVIDNFGKVSVITNAYPCRKCDTLFLKKNILRRHICSKNVKIMVLDQKPLRCEKCRTVFEDIYFLMQHKCITLNCSMCPLQFYLQDELDEHLDVFHRYLKFNPRIVECEQ